MTIIVSTVIRLGMDVDFMLVDHLVSLGIADFSLYGACRI